MFNQLTDIEDVAFPSGLTHLSLVSFGLSWNISRIPLVIACAGS
jgi:hypothetical protein